MAKCKSCGTDIIWIKTKNGKSMPCDVQKVKYWENPLSTGRVVTQGGRVVPCDFHGAELIVAGEGYIPHWSTCPDATRYRALQLIDCPYCGHEIKGDLILQEHQGKYSYLCPGCLYRRGDWSATIEDARKAWNETKP